MTYTVQLLNLRCLEAQENDGDEVIVKFNGAKVWASGRLKMHHHPRKDHHVSEFDFAGGRRHGTQGWQMLMPYNPKDFEFAGQVGESYLELWEEDFFRDDFLGRSPITAGDAEHGHITIAFVRDGANYLLTYRVTAD